MDKYDPEGKLLNRQWITSSTPSFCTGRGILALDSATNIYLAGLFTGTNTFTNAAGNTVRLENVWNFRRTIMLLKLNPAGQIVWGVQASGCYECLLGDVFRVAVDDLQNVYLGGGSWNYPLLTKYSNGDHPVVLWNKPLGPSMWDFTLYQRTNIFVAGNIVSQASSFSGGDIIVARLGSDGRPLEGTRAGGAQEDTARALALDREGNAYVTGFFQGAARFGSNSVSSTSTQDIFVARLQTSQPALRTSLTGNQLRLSWPNLADGFSVESAGNISAPFTASNIPVQTNGSEFFVTVPIAGPTNGFFRLRR